MYAGYFGSVEDFGVGDIWSLHSISEVKNVETPCFSGVEAPHLATIK